MWQCHLWRLRYWRLLDTNPDCCLRADNCDECWQHFNGDAQILNGTSAFPYSTLAVNCANSYQNCSELIASVRCWSCFTSAGCSRPIFYHWCNDEVRQRLFKMMERCSYIESDLYWIWRFDGWFMHFGSVEMCQYLYANYKLVRDVRSAAEQVKINRFFYELDQIRGGLHFA